MGCGMGKSEPLLKKCHKGAAFIIPVKFKVKFTFFTQ